MSKKKGFLANLFGGKKSGGCCNMEIVEEPKKKSGCCNMEIIEESDCGCKNVSVQEASSCCCGDSDTTETSCCGEIDNSTLTSIKVLGSGCKNCHVLLENVEHAIKNMELSVEVEYITEMEKIMSYGVMSMPALVVNEQVVSTGKVLKTEDVEKLLNKLFNT